MRAIPLVGNRNTRPGSHLGSAYLTVSFGPPKLTGVSGGGMVKCVTVGLIQDLAVAQQRQIIRLFEVGNKEQWLVPSKVRPSLQMRRVLYDGPTLLKYYAYGLMAEKWDDMTTSNDLWTIGKGWGADHDEAQGEERYKEMLEALGYPENDFDLDAPGQGDFWINLASDVFSNAIGILIQLKQPMPNGSVESYGAVYLERCLISSHVFSLAAETRLLAEQVSIEFARTVPLEPHNRSSIARIEAALAKTFGNS